MTEKYAAEDIANVVITDDASGNVRPCVDITPAQRAAVAVALERPEEVVKAMTCDGYDCAELWTNKYDDLKLCDKCNAEYYDSLGDGN